MLKGLYLSVCRQARLHAVLSKDPQLREDVLGCLAEVEEQYWQGVCGFLLLLSDVTCVLCVLPRHHNHIARRYEE